MTVPAEPQEMPGAEPAVLTGIRIGYARVSTGGQKLERQLDALRAAGCRRIFAEKQSGRDTDRPELTACLAFMTAGDTLVVPSLDRLSRSLQDLITTVGDLRRPAPDTHRTATSGPDQGNIMMISSDRASAGRRVVPDGPGDREAGD
ncbi:MAG: recombinase family protein [Streptosporangiaceae bacterium]